MDDMIKAATRAFLFDVRNGAQHNASTIVEKAMRHGYELGLQKGLENLEAALDASFDSGFEYGAHEGAGGFEGERNPSEASSYDDGYLQGVQDARSSPTLADLTVQDILAVRAEDHYERLGAAAFDDGGLYNEPLVKERAEINEDGDEWCDICQAYGCVQNKDGR